MTQVPTHHPSDDALLAFATGAADTPLRLMLELHLARCPRCAGAAAELAEPGAVLLRALPSAAPPPDLFEKIWTKVSAHPLPDPGGLPLPPSVLAELPPQEGWRWHPLLKKGSRSARVLREGPGHGALFLVHLPPGSAFPRHRHVGPEASLILAGGALDGDVVLEAGDFRASEAGSHHAPQADPVEGCWFLARVEGGDVRLRGWRGLLQRALEAWARLRGPAVTAA